MIQLVRKFSLTLLISMTSLLTSPAVLSDNGRLVVVVSQSSNLESITVRQVRRLFLGKSIKLPNGSRAKLATFEPARTLFNEKALRRTNAQVDAAWSRLKFSGRALEPQEFSDPQRLGDYLDSTPNAIGYLTTAAADSASDLRSLLVVE